MHLYIYIYMYLIYIYIYIHNICIIYIIAFFRKDILKNNITNISTLYEYSTDYFARR